MWLDIEVAWPKSTVGGQRRLGGPLCSTEKTFFCPCSFQRCVRRTYSSTGGTCGPVRSHCVLLLLSVVLFIMVVFVIFPTFGFVSVYLQMLKLQRGKSYKGKSHKYTLPQTGGGACSDFRQLHWCFLLSYRFTEHTFGKSKDRRRFLLLIIEAHLVSPALQLVISVTQPLYLVTRPL